MEPKLPEMKTKGPNPWDVVKNQGLSEVLNIYFKINQLKQLYRQGWLRHIEEEKCETVADHVFGATILAFLINKAYSLNLNLEKVLTLSLFHELGEIKVGDLTPYDGISKKEKHRLEKEVFAELFQNFIDKDEIISISNEVAAKETKEAVFVSQVEQFEMFLQSIIYKRLYGGAFSEFKESAEKILGNSFLEDLMKELKNL